MLPRRLIHAAAAILAAQVAAGAALAHHPTGGMTPMTFMHGLLSGIGHPIIGIDHFAFVVGMGLLAAIAGYGLMLPALFIGAMVAGLGVQLAGINVPAAEAMLAMSVLLIGVAVVRPREGQGRWLEGGLFALAGLLHGYAFAEAVIGAEPTPLMAYIIGLAATQLAIAATVYHMASARPQRQAMLAPAVVRGVGMAIIAVGAVFLVLNSGGAA